MPFIKKSETLTSQAVTDSRNIFIGRKDELLFYKQHILEPEDPANNIISISGQGGVGKSTLLTRLIDETSAPNFKDYCLTALVDERQTTSISVMERFAGQLGLTGKFLKLLRQYKEALLKERDEQDILPEELMQRVPDFTGAIFEGIPIAGPVLREGTKTATAHLIDKRKVLQKRKIARQLDNPLDELTKAFVTELNRLADTKISLSSTWKKRQRRVILFFDTFEKLAAEIVPWLLDHFLTANINNNVVLVIAGRDPIERASSNSATRWLPYYEHKTIHHIVLDTFNEEETRDYLDKRGIIDPVQTDTIWQLSRGLPLYLSLLTTNLQGTVDPTKTVIDNFLRWIPEQEQVRRQLALDGALLSKPFNRDDLEAFKYVPKLDRSVLYLWLIGQPFVRSIPQDGRYLYHDLAQELFSRHLYQYSQREYYSTRRSLANYYQGLLEKVQEDESETVWALEKEGKTVYHSPQWVELTMAVVYQQFMLPEHASHISSIKLVLNAYEYSAQTREIVRVLRSLSEEWPANQMKRGSRSMVKLLLRYIEADSPEQKGKLLNAADELLRTVASESSFPPKLLAHIYRKRGFAYKKELEAYEQAKADFDRAIELDSYYARAYASRWDIYRLRGEYAKAMQDLNRAVELDPNNGWMYGLRGLTYLELGDTMQAELDFKRSSELAPERIRSEWMTEWLGMCQESSSLHRINRLESIAEVEQNQEPVVWPVQNLYTAHICQGVACYLLEDFSAAQLHLEKAKLLKPRWWDAHFWSGMVCAMLGQNRESASGIEKALELGMPSILLAPLHWLEQKRPEFYEKYASPILARFDA